MIVESLNTLGNIFRNSRPKIGEDKLVFIEVKDHEHLC